MSSGVYEIRHYASGRSYVGSSQDLEARWRKHQWMLRRGEHHCPALQSAWNKHGESAFSFVTIDEVEPCELIAREQHYIETLKPYFNASHVAGSPMRGRRHSDDTKAAMSASRMGNQYRLGKRHSEAAKELRRQAMKGRRPRLGFRHTPEAKARIALAMQGKKHALGHKQSAEERAMRSAAQLRRYAREKAAIQQLLTGSI